jgi:hypothetical protein
VSIREHQQNISAEIVVLGAPGFPLPLSPMAFVEKMIAKIS